MISWVSFVNADVGYLLCGQESDADLFSSIDGGSTWIHVEARVAIKRIITGITFLDESRGWITTSWDNGEGGIFTTVDGGLTWQEVPLEAPDGPPFWRFEPPQFDDARHGWMIVSRDNGTPGNLFRTLDGGKTWQQSTPPGELATTQ